MATNKGASPSRKTPTSTPSKSYTTHPKPRMGGNTQPSSGGLNKAAGGVDPEKGTGGVK